VARAVISLATGADDGKPSLLAGAGWPAMAAGSASSDLGTLLASGMPASVGRRSPLEVAANLADDPGPWLLRALAALNVDRLAVLVPNNHPDLASQESQEALTRLVAAKYLLRLRRSSPVSSYAVVQATAVRFENGPAPVAHDLLCRAHGKIGNVWREALIRRGAEQLGKPLTKNDARSVIAGVVTRQSWLNARLIDLPRHAIRTLLDDAEASERALG